MAVDIDALRSLPAAEKLRIVELLWDDLGASDVPIPIPDWVGQEADRRRQQMLQDPSLGSGHEETWRRIRRRDG